MAISRRNFVQTCALGAFTLTSRSLLGFGGDGSGDSGRRSGPASRELALNDDWRFGGRFFPAALAPDFNDTAFARVTLPHTVAKLSWQDWKAEDWTGEWIYRRHFSLPPDFRGRRVFLEFDGVVSGAAPVINGHALPPHAGAYLPFSYEISEWVAAENNVLAVAVDSRWGNMPPDGSPKGPDSVDFFEPGGIPRGITLRAVPPIFIREVFAKPVGVLTAARRVDVRCAIDAAAASALPVLVQVELRQGAKVLARAQRAIRLEKSGPTETTLTLENLGEVALWDVEAPHLYDVVTTLVVDQIPLHDHRVRIGFREARFELEGFRLNGRRLQLFGLNRHELFPYAGFAMPRRAMRRDAEILRREFNCNIVRCSHYPQSEAFLDACDELGLLVWEEMPGWHYIGDEAWRERAIRNVEDMVRRDRNHAAIVIWGVRINESANNPEFYRRTTAAAKALDDSRPASGAMDGSHYSTKDWSEDVFAYNDYRHASPDGSVTMRPPLPGVPYFITEEVGQIVGLGPGAGRKYRRAGDAANQAKQAIYHAQAHDQAGRDPRNAGVIAWCAFDYGSPQNAHHGVKCPGVADVFRIPKLGASFYLAQVSPAVRPVIHPNFYWTFGSSAPRSPGKRAAIFSNCDRLEVLIDGRSVASLRPDRAGFPHVKYPPFFCDLDRDGSGAPELRIDGFVGGNLVLSKSFSSDPAQDQFLLQADDAQLIGDGADATRLVFKVADKFGEQRLFSGGEVAFEIAGPGILVGDNPFSLADSGGAGAVWIKTLARRTGRIEVTARHSVLGQKSVRIEVGLKAPAQSSTPTNL